MPLVKTSRQSRVKNGGLYPSSNHMIPIRYGLIGYGLFGRHHARLIQQSAELELVAISARSSESRTAAAEDHPQAAVLADYRQVLERDDVDIVDIVVPNRLHFEIAHAALQAGKHILLEKPMALEVEQCDVLLALAEQKQRTIAVGHELRLSSLWGRVRELIDNGVIGRPQYTLIELSRFPYRQGSEGWRYDKERVGSWVLEEPIHFFDLARWYMESSGEPTQVTARGNARDPSRADLYDNFTAVIDFADKSYAVVSQTLAAFGHHQTAKIVGTEGTIWAHWSAADARSEQASYGLVYGLGDDVTEETLAKPAGELLELADEVVAVANAVRYSTPPPCTGLDGRWSTALCLAAEQSIRTGDPQEV
jgi:myo-inositol 2-dehydrogenase/D-chiro-inositol 1-dehydrogenase